MPNPNGGRPGHAEPVCDFGRFLSLRVCCANGIPGRIGTSTTGIGFFLPGFIVLDHGARNRIRCGVGWRCRARPGMLPGKLRFTFRFLLLLSRALGCGVAGAGHPVTLPSVKYRSNMLYRISLVPRASHGQGSCRRGPRRNASSQQTAGVERIASPRQFVGTASVLFPTLTRGIAAICHTSPCRLLDLPQPTQRNPMPPRKTRRGS